jgi:PTS system nitrogen regulatory IIA component
LAILGRIKKVTNFVDFFNRFKKKSILKIINYLEADNITFLESKNRNDVILELVDLLCKSKKLTDKKLFYKKIIEREKIISTGIGMGIAIPHAKLKHSDDFFIAIGILKKYKINWNSIDNLPVRLVFMIGGPEVKQNEYLQLLSKLTEALKNDNLRRNIFKATQKEEVINAFRQF